MMPIFTTLGGWLVLRQQFLGRFLIGMAVAVIGAVAIGLGLISQAVGQGLLTYSLAKFPSSFVAVSMLAIIVIAAILAMPI